VAFGHGHPLVLHTPLPNIVAHETP